MMCYDLQTKKGLLTASGNRNGRTEIATKWAAHSRFKVYYYDLLHRDNGSSMNILKLL